MLLTNPLSQKRSLIVCRGGRYLDLINAETDELAIQEAKDKYLSKYDLEALKPQQAAEIRKFLQATFTTLPTPNDYNRWNQLFSNRKANRK